MLLAGCAGGNLPEPGRMPKEMDVVKSTDDHFHQDTGDVAVRRIITPGSGFKDGTVHPKVAEELRRRPLSIQFNTSDSTLGDLITALSANDIQFAFGFDGKVGASTGAGAGAPAGRPQSFPAASSAPNSPPGTKPTAASSSSAASAASASAVGGSDMSRRRLPFTSYKGTVGGLLNVLRQGMGIVSWQEDGLIYLSDTDQYAVTLPQNEDIMKAISATLKDLGANDIVSSVDGGRIIYSAVPGVHDRAIGPFLQRAARNLATIDIQVAVVNLALNDKSGQGFDWSSLSGAVDQRASAISAANQSAAAATAASTAASTSTTGAAGTLGTAGSTLGSSASTAPASIIPQTGIGQKGGVLDMTSANLLLGTTSLGKVFGVQTVTSVAGAINWLSTFGNTNITQQVDVRTLSGKEVKLSSGEEIPYVTGVGVGTLGSGATANSNVANSGNSSGSTLGTAQTDKVKVGLDVTMTPRFESEGELVTIEFKMKLASLIEMVQLNAGNQLGTLTQPHTADQELNDLIRVRAGQTVVIGGLQKDSENFTGNEPTALRDWLHDSNQSVGSRKQDVTRSALFIILRPTVTVFEPELTR